MINFVEFGMKRNNSEIHRHELKKAIQIFGSQQQMADEINAYITARKLNAKTITQQNISNWLHRDKKIARDYPPVIEAITNGIVRAFALRGDGKAAIRRG
jgi:hypothetical protein